MSKKNIFILALGLLLIPSFAYSRDNASTTFFLGNYVFNYRTNPALRPQNAKGFAGIAIDNISVGLCSNLTLSNMLFPIDGKLYTGLNERVDADTFLNGLKNVNDLNMDINMNLLSIGASHGDKAFSTFEFNIVSETGLSVPKSLFSLLKKGTSDGIYQIDDISLFTSEYLEVAYGLSFRINDNLSVGGRVKALLGLAQMDLNINKMRAETNGGQIGLDINGEAQAYMNIVRFDEDFENPTLNLEPSGLGAALDLGAEYKFDKFDFSLSLKDLGAMSWARTIDASIDYSGSIDAETMEEDFDLEDYSTITQYDNPIFETKSLSATVVAGAKYAVSKHLSAGLLATYRSGRNPLKEAVLGASFTPFKAFSLAVSGGVNNYGTCFGAALNLRLAFLNFFLASDAISFHVNPQYLPIHSINNKLTTGLVLVF